MYIRKGKKTLDKVLLVGAGGFIGSVLRYLMGGFVQSVMPAFYSTLVINVTGGFAIGLLSQYIEAQNTIGAGARAFLVVGILGGYTTFSAFGNETINLMRTGEHFSAWINIGGHIVLGLCAVALGRYTVHLLLRG